MSDLIDNEAWKAGYREWEAYKSLEVGTVIDNLSHYGEAVGTKGFYETALLDALLEAEDFDSMWNGISSAEGGHDLEGNSITSQIMDAAKTFGKPDNINLSDLKVSDLSEEEKTQLMQTFEKQYRYRAMKDTSLGRGVLDASETIGSFARNAEKMETLAGYSESMQNALMLIADECGTNDVALEWACYDLISKIEGNFNPNIVLAQDMLTLGVKSLINWCIGETWGQALNDLGGDWKNLLGMYYVSDATKLVSADAQYESYRRMLVMEEIMAASQRARSDAWSAFEANPSSENAATLGSVCDILIGEYLTSNNYARTYLESVDESLLAQLLDLYYGTLGANEAVDNLQAKKDALKNNYLNANMVIEDISSQDNPQHDSMVSNQIVQIYSQSDFDDWADITYEIESQFNRRTVLRTCINDVLPQVLIRHDTLLAEMIVHESNLAFAEGADLDVLGDMKFYAAGDGGGIIILGNGNTLSVSGDVNADGVSMSAQSAQLSIGGNLRINGTDTVTNMVAGRVEVSGSLWLPNAGSIYGDKYGFLPKQQCVLAFPGSQAHTIESHGDSIGVGIGRVELPNTALYVSGSPSITLACDAHLRGDAGGALEFGDLDLNGHSLYIDDSGLFCGTVSGAGGSASISADCVQFREPVSLSGNSSLTINQLWDLSKASAHIDMPGINLSGNSVLTINGNLQTYGDDDEAAIVNLIDDSALAVSGETHFWGGSVNLHDAASMTMAGDVYMWGLSMDGSRNVITVKGKLFDGGTDTDQAIKSGIVSVCGNVEAGIAGDYALNFKNGSLLKLVGAGNQKLIASSGYCFERVGVWNSNISLSSSSISYKVVAGNLALASIDPISSQKHTGSAICPSPTVKLGNTTLKLGADYTVGYQNNVNVGTATVTVTGKGNYTGTKSATFKINAAPAKVNLSKASITGLKSKTYSGKALTQSPVVKVGAKTLKSGTDYTVGYKNNKNAGTATITVTGKGSYTGSKSATFKINKAKQPMTAKAVNKTAKVKALKKKAVALTKTVTVKKRQGALAYKNASTQKAAKKFKVNAKRGTITVPKGTKKGTYKVKIKVTAKGNSNYKSGSKTVTVKVKVK